MEILGQLSVEINSLHQIALITRAIYFDYANWNA